MVDGQIGQDLDHVTSHVAMVNEQRFVNVTIQHHNMTDVNAKDLQPDMKNVANPRNVLVSLLYFLLKSIVPDNIYL